MKALLVLLAVVMQVLALDLVVDMMEVVGWNMAAAANWIAKKAVM